MVIELNTRFQIAAVLFFIVFVSNYYRYKRLPMLSSKIFNVMTCLVAVNLCFDILTVYTVNNMDDVPSWLNRLCHQLFISSLCIVTSLMYYYVTVLSNNQKRLRGREVLYALAPVVASIFMTAFGPLKYKEGPTGAYSYGLMEDTVYIVALIYLIMIVIVVRKSPHDKAGQQRRHAIYICLAVWILTAVIQLINHTLMVTSMALVLVLYYLYYAFENQKETVEIEIGSRNRKGFYQMVHEYLERKKEFVIVNLVYTDMLQIYRQYGHEMGHRYMAEMVSRLQEIYGIFVFRPKGNVMSVFVPQFRMNELNTMLKWTQQVVERPVYIEGISLARKVHINVLECPKYASTMDDVSNVIDYISDTDREFEDNAKIFFIDNGTIDHKERYLAIEELLENAIWNDGFEVFYQPIYHPKEKKFLSAEALVRLKDKSAIGYISPEEFIPIAERRGMVSRIGMIVFRKVCKFIQTEKPEKYGVRYIEINLSGVQCQDKSLASQLEAMMIEYGINPELIDLEITETAAINAGETLFENMKRLKKSGVTFAMDDFGTGYSNLVQMFEVAYEYVKLDKSLIWPAFGPDKEKGRILLEEVIAMIQHLGITVIAEGIETKEQADWLIEHKVGHLQGYYFSRPVSEQDYLKFLIAKVFEYNNKRME